MHKAQHNLSGILTCLGVAASPMALAVVTVAIADSIASLVNEDIYVIYETTEPGKTNEPGGTSELINVVKLINLVNPMKIGNRSK